MYQITKPPPKRKAPSKQNKGARKRPPRQPVSTPDYSSDSNSEKDGNINGDMVEQDQVVEDSPSFTIILNTDRMITLRAEEMETELMLENEVLKKRLHQARGQSKMKRLINKEDKLVMLRLRRYVKEQLWKKVKFITDGDVLERALNKCADRFSIDDKERYDWKQRMSREVQQSINNRRNNCINDLGEVFIGK